MVEFHFLRPYWLLALLPLLILAIRLWRLSPQLESWAAICDKELLQHLIKSAGQTKRHQALLFLFVSALLIVLSLAGPSWYRLPVPSYLPMQPRVFLLDLSYAMLEDALSPNRLTRAKFKLQDLLQRRGIGQFGLLVYTGEPFIVSPLTDDGQTISELLPMLTPDIMPVEGQRLDRALDEAAKLIAEAGFNQGQVLVLTAAAPNSEALAAAEKLATNQIQVSILPVLASNEALSPSFQALANAGEGKLLQFSNTTKDLNAWLKAKPKKNLSFTKQDDIPQWRDEGPWLLLPALLLLLPVFRRGWLQRISA